MRKCRNRNIFMLMKQVLPHVSATTGFVIALQSKGKIYHELETEESTPSLNISMNIGSSTEYLIFLSNVLHRCTPRGLC